MQNNLYEIYNGLAIQSTATGDEIDYVDLFDEPDYNKITNLAMIEKFVERIQKSKGVAFDVHPLNTRSIVHEKRLAIFYKLIDAVVQESYSDRFQYSPRVGVFFEACKSMDITLGQFRFGHYLEIEQNSKWTYVDIFNELILEIRHRCQQSKFKTRLKRHERNVRRRRGKAFMWLRALYEARSRYLFLVLNLSYRKDIRKQVTIPCASPGHEECGPPACSKSSSSSSKLNW